MGTGGVQERVLEGCRGDGMGEGGGGRGQGRQRQAIGEMAGRRVQGGVVKAGVQEARGGGGREGRDRLEE